MLSLVPSTAVITADDTQAYTTEAYDAVGQHWDVTAGTTFSISSGAGGNFTANEYTPEVAGSWTVTATHTSSSTTNTSALTVNAGAVNYIVVSTDNSTITADETAIFAAEAFDQHGNTLGDVSTNSTAFSIDAGANGSWAANVYTAETVGAWTVTGNHTGSFADTASLTVTVGALDDIELSPSTSTITADDTQTYTVEAFDLDDNSRGDVTASANFSISPSAGGSWAANVYTPEVVSPGSWTVTTMYGGKSDTASLTVDLGVLHHVDISPASANVTAGDTINFSAWAYDQRNNSRGNVSAGTTTWSSSNPGIASIQGQINGDRVVEGYNPGTVTITATRSGVSGTASLTVNAATLSSIAVSPVDPYITVDSTQAFRAIATYSDDSEIDITSTANWTSDNETVATISTDGVATGLAVGSAVIRAELDSMLSNTSTLNVIDVPLLSIAVTSPDSSVNAGEPQQYNATGNYSGTLVDLTSDVIWSSDNESVAIIKPGGLATTYSQGTANITAAFDEKTGSKALTVNPAIIESVVVTPADSTITFVSGSPPTLQFSATTVYSDGTTTDNTSTATWTIPVGGGAANVTSTGLVTANAAGTPTVNANVGGMDGQTGLEILDDTVAPVIKLSQPLDGFTTSSTNVAIIGHIDDTSDAASAEVFVTYPDGSPAGTFDIDPDPDVNGDFSENVTLQDGTNSIQVRATDVAGNKGRSGSKSVKVNPVKPTITITSPVEGLVTPTAAVTLQGSVTGANSAIVRLNGTTVGTVGSGAFSTSVTLTAGKNSIVVSGYGTGGTTAAFLGTSGIRTVTLDQTAPTVKIDSPASGSIVNTSRVTISGTIDDPLVTTANLTVGGVAKPPVPVVNGSFSQDVTLAAGANAITVSATDSAENTGSATPVTVTLDTTKPIITVTAPANNLLTNDGGILVTGSLDDLSISTATLNVNGTTQTISVLPDGSFNQMVALTTGANTMTVSASDGVNVGSSGVINVTLDSTQPDIKITLGEPTDSIIITVTSNEALSANPTISGLAAAVTMTPTGVNEWTGVCDTVLEDTSYTATATGSDLAGNPDTATATFSTGLVTTAANAATVQNDTTRMDITTNTDVTDQTMSVTNHTENPAAKADPATDAGVFIEITASGNLTDSLVSIDVQVDYIEDDMIARGIDEATLKLYTLNDALGTWDVVPGSASNVTGDYVYGTLTHLSKFGCFGDSLDTPTPTTDGDSGGGGGGAYAPSLSGLSGRMVLDDLGFAITTSQLTSLDGKVVFYIIKGTELLDSKGNALGSMSAAAVISSHEPPANATIIFASDFGPDGAVFTPAIPLTMYYDAESLPEGISEDELYIAYWDGSQWLALESTVDTVTQTVYAEVSHFTQYAVLGTVPPPVTPPVTPSVTPPVTPPVPAAFTTSGLSISPSDVSVGERVTISSLITNTGELSGSYTLSLKINNVVVDTKDVTLEGGASQTVTFTAAQDVTGTYAVIVGTQSGTFNVTAPPEVVEEVSAPLAWWIWLIIGLVIVAIIGAGWFVIRRRG
ncbi:beta strand repeat-containing protein [Chloroflexota bacterium]